MNLFTPILAPFKGVQLCLFDREVRKASILPWCVGALVALLASGFLIVFFPKLTAFMLASLGNSISVGSQLLSWLASAFISILVGAVLTMLVVLVLCSYYHYRIAQIILVKRGYELKELTPLREIGRSSVTEFLKLIWLIPLYIILFLLGLIPFFTPLAFIGWGVLAAYQFIDYPLDTLHFGAFSRLGFIFKHFLGASLFGVTLVVLSAIPFVIFFITPVAVAGASWLIVEMGWVRRD